MGGMEVVVWSCKWGVYQKSEVFIEKGGCLIEKWRFPGFLVKNRGFSGKMGVSRGLWLKIGVFVEKSRF